MRFLRNNIGLFLCVFLIGNINAQISISNTPPNNNPNHLINNVLVGGGVAISNISFTGSNQQIGAFSSGNSIGMDSGIVMSSGHALDADFSGSEDVIRKIVSSVLSNQMEKGYSLNVNIPKVPKEEIKGIKVCRQAKAYWDEDFEKREDPFGGTYYWLTGEFIYQDEGEDTDIWALRNNYVSIVPTQFDLTHYGAMEILKSWNGL